MYYILLFGETFSTAGRVVQLPSPIITIVLGSWSSPPIRIGGQLIIIKLVIIIGGVQKGPKVAFAFPTLNSY